MGLLSRHKQPMDNEQRCSKELTILNRNGLHARPAAMFVKIASRYQSDVWVEKEGEKVNGKSIMGLMMLAAGNGTKLHIIAEGPDAQAVVQELQQLIETHFGEE